jgi:DNA-binding transcriptional ArsR family regulator
LDGGTSCGDWTVAGAERLRFAFGAEKHLDVPVERCYYSIQLINYMAKYSSRAIDSLSLTLAALADPTRRAIIEKLAIGQATVNTLAEPLRMSLPGVSKHLKVLQKAGLVIQGRDKQRRPCRLNAARLQDVANWAERFRRNWEESFKRLDEYLSELTEKEKSK